MSSWEIAGRSLDAVTAIASPVHYFECLSGLGATVGGVTLTNVGSASFDAGDHPAVAHSGGGGGGGGSNVIVASDDFFRGARAEEQIRRHGLPAWSGAELRRAA